MSVAPSLWQICVTPLPPGSTTVFPVQQLSVNAAAAKWSWTATCRSKKMLPRCSRRWSTDWAREGTAGSTGSPGTAKHPRRIHLLQTCYMHQPGAARVGKRPGKIPNKQGIFGLKQRISSATKGWKLPRRESRIWLHQTATLCTATVYSSKSAPQSPSHNQVTKLSLMLITERLWKYLVLFKPCKKSSTIHCNVFFIN